jgi:tRNA(fMet)-specific endonuclease VapC
MLSPTELLRVDSDQPRSNGLGKLARVGELRTGFALGSRPKANEAGLAAFIRNPVVTVLEIDDSASRIYAEIVVALRRAGTPLPTNDVWIAAVAAREGATVVTYDEHFRLIDRVGAHVLTA